MACQTHVKRCRLFEGYLLRICTAKALTENPHHCDLPHKNCLQIVQLENKLRIAGGRGQDEATPQDPSTPPPQPPSDPTSNSDSSPLTQPGPQFHKLEPGRHCQVALPMPAAKGGPEEPKQEACFNAAVLDVDSAAAKRAARDCAVFIVPQVRHAGCHPASFAVG